MFYSLLTDWLTWLDVTCIHFLTPNPVFIFRLTDYLMSVNRSVPRQLLNFTISFLSPIVPPIRMSTPHYSNTTNTRVPPCVKRCSTSDVTDRIWPSWASPSSDWDCSKQQLLIADPSIRHGSCTIEWFSKVQSVLHINILEYIITLTKKIKEKYICIKKNHYRMMNET